MKLEITLDFPEALLDADDGIVEHLLVEDARKVIRGAVQQQREQEARAAGARAVHKHSESLRRLSE